MTCFKIIKVWEKRVRVGGRTAPKRVELGDRPTELIRSGLFHVRSPVHKEQGTKKMTMITQGQMDSLGRNTIDVIQ